MLSTNTTFDKEAFKKEVREQVKVLYRRTLQEASPQQVYQAVCYAVKDTIIDNWMKTQKAMDAQDPKTVYYMSMEFLLGRSLKNHLFNLGILEEARKAIKSLGSNIDNLL